MKKLMMPAICLAAHASACPASVLVMPQNDAGDTEEMLKKVNQKLDALNGEVKQTAEDALKQAKDAGTVSAEVKQKADKLLNEQTNLTKQVEKITNALEGIPEQMLELSQKVAEGGGSAPGGVMSLGRAVVAEEEQIKAFVANGCGGTLSINVTNAITTAAGSGGGLIFPQEERDPVRMPKRRLLVRELLSQGKTGTNLVPYRKQEVRTNAAAPVAEGGTYAASTYGWGKGEAPVRKIGHVTNVSEEAVADADLLQTEIDTEMRYGLDLEEEKQVLAGPGTGESLSGLLTEAPAFVAATGLPNATRIDRLRLAFLQIALEDYIGSGVVLSPIDWAAIELQKVGGTDGRYVFGNPHAVTTPSLWGKDVVETASMSQGEWLAGDFATAATFYDRQETEVLISSEHGTNFVEDMLTMKARKRVALAIKRGLAMVQGDFTFA